MYFSQVKGLEVALKQRHLLTLPERQFVLLKQSSQSADLMQHESDCYLSPVITDALVSGVMCILSL